MKLEIGKVYKFREDLEGREDLSFGYTKGCFLGYAGGGWPRFMLNVERGTECIINATDENFVEVERQPNPQQPQEKGDCKTCHWIGMFCTKDFCPYLKKDQPPKVSPVEWVKLPELTYHFQHDHESAVINQLIHVAHQLQQELSKTQGELQKMREER